MSRQEESLMSRQELLIEAKRGNAEAISRLMNEKLNPKGVKASIALKGDCLNILIEAPTSPPQATFVPLMQTWMANLASPAIVSVRVLGRKQGEPFDDWEATFTVQGASPAPVPDPEPVASSPPSEPAPPTTSGAIELAEAPKPLAVEAQSPSTSFWGGVMGQLGNAAGAVGDAVGGVATGAAGLVAGAAGAVGGAAVGAGGAIVGAGGAIASAAVNAGGALGNAALNLTDQAGYVIDLFSNSPELQRVFGPISTKIPSISKFLEPIFNVDVVRAETHVQHLQAKYPNESVGDIAHRLMLEKSIIAGGSGIATSLPGFAAALFAVDIAANAALQAELVYQIACLYGFNLQDPARKAEVAAILGLSIGGSQAAGKLTARLGLTAFGKNIPIAGSVIGASTNAAAIYAMGYAACRFYEAKLANNSLTLEATLAATDEANEDYLASITDDQVAMDWILVWIFLAGHPDKTLADLIPQLDSLNLSPASISELKSGMQTLPSLDDLLPRVNDDFGVALLAKCQSIAIADGVISSEEQAILNRLNTHFAASLQAVSLDLAED